MKGAPPELLPGFIPGGSAAYEEKAWETRNYRLGCGWSEKDANLAYYDEMSAEGYEAEAG